MKKILGVAFLLLFVSASFSGNLSRVINEKYKPGLLRTKHIDATITSTGGCVVHVVGDVEYTIIPPRFLGFTGTVTISGPKGCPNGSMTFSRTSTGLYMTVDDPDYRMITQVTWGGTQTTYSSLMNDPNVNAELVAFLNSLD